jgi:hypothetical protein
LSSVTLLLLMVLVIGSHAPPALDRLMDDARRGRFQVVCCWSISRFGRSMVNAVLAMHELTELGIRLVALQQSVDTGTVVGRGVAALLAALALVDEMQSALDEQAFGPLHGHSRCVEAIVCPLVAGVLQRRGFEPKTTSYNSLWSQPKADGAWGRGGDRASVIGLEVKLHEDYAAPLSQVVAFLAAYESCAVVHVRAKSSADNSALAREITGAVISRLRLGPWNIAP